MRGLSVYFSSTALGVGLFLAAQSLPKRAMALHPKAPRPTFALDSRVSGRLSGSAEFSRAIAEGRAPVPWARAYNAAWVPEETPAGRTSRPPHSAAVERNAQAVAPKWAAGAATGRRCASPNMG
jgi:hypothetical protein